VNVVFDPARPDLQYEVTWFQVPENAPALGIPAAFVSENWDDGGDLSIIGEKKKTLAWIGGDNIQVIFGHNPGRCGTDEQWLHGGPAPVPTPPVNPLTGLPLCCGDTKEFKGQLFRPGEAYGCKFGLYIHRKACGEAYLPRWSRVHPNVSSPGEVYLPRVTITESPGEHPGEVYLPAARVQTGGTFNPGEAYPVPCMHATLTIKGKPGEVYEPPIKLAVDTNGHPAEVYSAAYTAWTPSRPGEVYQPKVSVTVTSGVTTPCCTGTTVNATLTATCTNASSGLSAFVGVTVTLTYSAGAGGWAGTGSVAGNSGNFLFGCQSGFMGYFWFLQGASFGNWLFGNPGLSGPTGGCGPPLSVTFTGQTTQLGMTMGTTDWVVTG
jgi:hypothetical protein